MAALGFAARMAQKHAAIASQRTGTGSVSTKPGKKKAVKKPTKAVKPGKASKKSVVKNTGKAVMPFARKGEMVTMPPKRFTKKG